MPDFFISYTSVDGSWAEWIGWILEAAGFSVTLQKWDFRPGRNFALEMQRATTESKRTIAILSPNYMKSAFGAPEWAAAFADDPQGLKGKLVPVRVANCNPEGLFKATIYIDLVGFNEEEARQALLEGVAERRAKPSSKPDFPGKPSIPKAVAFPGGKSGTIITATRAPRRYMPRICGNPSDLEKRRFVKEAFETIRREFEERLYQLARDNAGVDVDFTPVDATTFLAEIFVNGESQARCRIWQGGMFSSDGISYAEGSTMVTENACNDVLSVASGGLVLHAMMNMNVGRAGEGLDVEHLSPAEAAEYLWRRFCWTLER